MAAIPAAVNPVLAVDLYLQGLVDKDLSRVPFADDLRFADPLLPAPLTSKADALVFLAPLLPAVVAIDVERHVVEGNLVATQWVAHTVWGRIPIFELFRVVDGTIVEMEAYFDPRPIVAAAQRAG